MASKKYSFLTGALCLLASYGFAQTGTTTTGSYSVSDSSVIPTRRMPQHTEFMNGTYDFPARPRSQWELGIKGGVPVILGDVAPQLPSFGGGIHVRKALGYLFSLRMEYVYANTRGLAWKPSVNYSNNPAWRGNYNAGVTPVYYNYKTNIQDLSLEGVFALNNIRFHKAKSGYQIYVLAGFGGSMYDVNINALNGNAPYNFSSVQGGVYKDRKRTRDELKRLLDDSYETPGDNHGNSRPTVFGNSFNLVGHVGGGVAFKLNDRVNLAIENRLTLTGDDLYDGQRWAEQVNRQPVLTRSFDAYNFTSLGLNLNLGKGVEPLYWLNPLAYAYSEIRNPRLMRLPKPVLPDTDGDGVTDQFDLEQTPAGCAVDTHGVTRDTDGDGVPDCRDKELVTPTYCQPVDADGVGKCPCPTGCVDSTRNDCAAQLGALPSVTFSGNRATLSNDAQSLLSSVAARLRNNPACRVVVVGYCQSSKSEQQRSWERVNAVINHMVEREGISADRFIFQYGQQGGDCNTVDLRSANEGEEGPANVPAPHPGLRR